MSKSKSHPCKHPQKAITILIKLDSSDAYVWCKKCNQKIYKDDKDNWVVIKQLNF